MARLCAEAVVKGDPVDYQQAGAGEAAVVSDQLLVALLKSMEGQEGKARRTEYLQRATNPAWQPPHIPTQEKSPIRGFPKHGGITHPHTTGLSLWQVDTHDCHGMVNGTEG